MGQAVAKLDESGKALAASPGQALDMIITMKVRTLDLIITRITMKVT